MTVTVDAQQIERAYSTVRDRLLDERTAAGYWVGELSTSPLSTATAIMAFEQVRKCDSPQDPDLPGLIERGAAWLAEHQNRDGGWGDTLKSFSNISTTMLAHASLIATGAADRYPKTVETAQKYIDAAGGIDAVIRRYGKDKTFSVPILTHCALAGLVDWKEIPALPFELACLPHRFYATIRLPVVSYALPALIAIGQVRHHFRRPRNPVRGWLRDRCVSASLTKLRAIQPPTGGYLEATPLTSFVTMSLAAKGLHEHEVVQEGVRFLKQSVLADGSWPIDTNLATWVTTLSVMAIGEELDDTQRHTVLDWLLHQQYRQTHRYTNAAPGGWAWTDLSGGVPDADDTPGAMLAVMKLADPEYVPRVAEGLHAATGWLLGLQNRDGGWPTFCRGWGTLPFDRSSPDITAHCIRALLEYSQKLTASAAVEHAIRRGFRFLDRQQQPDGSWLPLWFGNQHAEDEVNPLYGTAKVLLAYVAADRQSCEQVRRGMDWLRNSQNEDGGWGGIHGAPSTVEETALAVDTLLRSGAEVTDVERGLAWLIERVADGRVANAAPIGFYFAKLWYFEKLYPLIFAASALRTAHVKCQQQQPLGHLT